MNESALIFYLDPLPPVVFIRPFSSGKLIHFNISSFLKKKTREIKEKIYPSKEKNKWRKMPLQGWGAEMSQYRF